MLVAFSSVNGLYRPVAGGEADGVLSWILGNHHAFGGQKISKYRIFSVNMRSSSRRHVFLRARDNSFATMQESYIIVGCGIRAEKRKQNGKKIVDKRKKRAIIYVNNIKFAANMSMIFCEICVRCEAGFSFFTGCRVHRTTGDKQCIFLG